MSDETPAAPDDQPETNFEEALANLERIVHDLEDGQIGLSTALARYEQGVALLRQCYGLLERAERRIELLTGFDPATGPETAPFDDEASADLEAKGSRRSRRRSAPKPADEPKSSGGRVLRSSSDSPEVDDAEGLF
ncbi:MAG: exodeoxyribonuclease VII small subunit [Pirellulales bacterium]|nr:exodeoxyribonuclease VII small subunit [Pirellulales bacterium]